MNNLYIKWEVGYNIGIPIIDEQHRAIVSTINTYHYFYSRGKEETVLKPTLITLNQYTKTHFITEESIIEQTDYPDVLNHKTLHSDLITRMRMIVIEAVQENNAPNVLHFLKSWWLSHIRIEDVKYAPFVKNK